MGETSGTVRVAAYQAPLTGQYSVPLMLSLIREQVQWCEANDIEFLCCPEGILGGLADYARPPNKNGITVRNGDLQSVLRPLASHRVTTIIGFTEADGDTLYNSAALLQSGGVAGVYRKVHPAINRSVYKASDNAPVFTVGRLTFGIIICLDSMFEEPARTLVTNGAAVLFVPTNNAMPESKGGVKLVVAAQRADLALATQNRVSVVRADVAGRDGDSVSYGSSGVVGYDGGRLASARELTADLIVAEVAVRGRKGGVK